MRWNWRPWRKRPELRILDDFFPNLLTGFRVAEYNALYAAFPRLRVLSASPDFAPRRAEYARAHPRWADRVHPFAPEALSGCGLVYMNFLNNAIQFLPHLESRAIPFAFTLYPGGGFGLNEADSDAKLARVMDSPWLRAVVVTQPATRDYLRERNPRGVPVRFVPGVVVDPDYLAAPPRRTNDPTGAAKICFVAEKYMPGGLNKGFPAFAEAALRLAGEGAPCEFHVVGSFVPEDAGLTADDRRIVFHGRLTTPRLKEFFGAMDAIVSPNRPFLLHAGNFDGFPTGGCVEASLCGVAVVATDALGQNPGYADGREMLIVTPETDAVAAAMRFLAAHRETCAAIGARGQRKTRTLYSAERQIAPRIELLRALAQETGVRP